MTGPHWLWDALGLRVEVHHDASCAPAASPDPHPTGAARDDQVLRALVGLALRRNPRRAHLLVSRVLGKHLPVPPATALDAGARLAALVRALPAPGGGAARTAHEVPLVIGYCETATALGHAVSDGLPGSHYLHTTRRRVPGTAPLLEFVESHSHATHHWLMPADPGLLTAPGRLVLVDDELSTGRTATGTIRILQAFAPRSDYAVATLVDARPPAAREAFAALAAELGVRLDVVSLVAATVSVPDDVTERASQVRNRFAAGGGRPPAAGAAETAGMAMSDLVTSGTSAGMVTSGTAAAGTAVVVADGAAADPGDLHPVARMRVAWPTGLPDGGRHGWSPAVRERLTAALPALAEEVLAGLAGLAAPRDGLAARTGTVLVLGTEELMYVPMRLAGRLAEVAGRPVVYQATTRSPVHPLDVDGYAIRAALTFPAPDDPGRVSHVYNVTPGRYDDIVVVVDSGMDGLGPVEGGPDVAGLVAELRRCAPVTVVTIPCHIPGGTE